MDLQTLIELLEIATFILLLLGLWCGYQIGAFCESRKCSKQIQALKTLLPSVDEQIARLESVRDALQAIHDKDLEILKELEEKRRLDQE